MRKIGTRSGTPILSLAEHEEPVSSFTSKTVLSEVSQLFSHPPGLLL